MQGSMMHCGAEPINVGMLETLLPPPPTETHYPIKHQAVYDTALAKISDAGYKIANAKHYTNREHAHYFALLELDHEEQDHATMLALRNSYDKVFRASLAIGARVFVCDNLSFSGDIVVGHKNTINGASLLPERFAEAVTKIRFQQKKQELRFEEYREAPIDDRTADHLTMECYRRGIVNLQRIGQVNGEWYEPTSDHGPKTAWRFFNAVTRACNPKSNAQLMTLPRRTMDLHLLMDEFCDVDLPDESAINAEQAIDQAPRGFLSRILN